jgi:hypothetical protein
MLDAGIHEMEVLLGRYERDGASFLDGVPKKLLSDLYYLGDHAGSAVYGFFASSKLFVVGTPDGASFVNFLQARLQHFGLQRTELTAVLLTSCGPREVSGLPSLLEKFHTYVVTSPAGVRTIKDRYPSLTAVMSTQDLLDRGWFTVWPILLKGRGFAPVAYKLFWLGKTVLFSGRIPSGADRASSEKLLSDLSGSRDDVIEYLVSINELEELKPDLWLPEFPSDGQNANLYDEAWSHIISNNYQVGYYKLKRINLPR